MHTTNARRPSKPTFPLRWLSGVCERECGARACAFSSKRKAHVNTHTNKHTNKQTHTHTHSHTHTHTHTHSHTLTLSPCDRGRAGDTLEGAARTINETKEIGRVMTRNLAARPCCGSPLIDFSHCAAHRSEHHDKSTTTRGTDSACG